ncbi:glycosyltransferase family 4 protein [Methanobacterium sp. SMA-27]|uniref:glycosyltransferase family 4 protein n=1 Tax=Methanobacterium sp. SMA-27 TaxID=1495336 RepID=UPI000A9DA611|nr:glycosyltransferase family 4 protein [Methanobacterium sp. SMA-27]
MRILIINYMETTSPGGISKTVMETAKHLSKGNEVTVLQPNPSKLVNEEIYEDFKIIRVSSPFDNTKYFYGLNLEIYNYLKKHLKELNPDIVHVHGYHHLLPIETIHTIKRIEPELPIIFSPHLDVIRGRFAGKYLWNLYNFIARSVFPKTVNITSCSEFESNNIQDIGVDPDKIVLIPHGVDMIDTSKKIRDKTIKLMYSGHLIDRKGVDFILNSLNSLVNDNGVTNVVLTLVGEGPEKQKLKKMCRDLKIENYVEWKSFMSREKLIDQIKESDIYILLSKSEAYGIAVAEALALGTPCIVTNRTALKEFSNENGCYTVNFPPEPQEVADLIMRIYQDDVAVGPLSEKIRTWDKVSKDYERLYKEVIEIG